MGKSGSEWRGFVSGKLRIRKKCFRSLREAFSSWLNPRSNAFFWCGLFLWVWKGRDYLVGDFRRNWGQWVEGRGGGGNITGTKTVNRERGVRGEREQELLRVTPCGPACIKSRIKLTRFLAIKQFQSHVGSGRSHALNAPCRRGKRCTFFFLWSSPWHGRRSLSVHLPSALFARLCNPLPFSPSSSRRPSGPTRPSCSSKGSAPTPRAPACALGASPERASASAAAWSQPACRQTKSVVATSTAVPAGARASSASDRSKCPTQSASESPALHPPGSTPSAPARPTSFRPRRSRRAAPRPAKHVPS